MAASEEAGKGEMGGSIKSLYTLYNSLQYIHMFADHDICTTLQCTKTGKEIIIGKNQRGYSVVEVIRTCEL